VTGAPVELAQSGPKPAASIFCCVVRRRFVTVYCGRSYSIFLCKPEFNVLSLPSNILYRLRMTPFRWRDHPPHVLKLFRQVSILYTVDERRQDKSGTST
jgi:hypothetical protein